MRRGSCVRRRHKRTAMCDNVSSIIPLFLCILLTTCISGVRGSHPSVPFTVTSLDSPAFRSKEHCYRAAKCQEMNTTVCLSANLPYKTTSLTHLGGNFTEQDVHNYLSLWRGFQSIPRCWAVIQPFLCATFLPKCDNGTVALPTKEMCRMTRGPCRMIEIHHAWPDVLQCSKEDAFPSGCKNAYRDVKFNITGQCKYPLVETDNVDNWYPGIEGCGVQCENPLLSSEQHRQVHIFVAVIGFSCLICTLITVLTFAVDWKNTNKYPAVIICYINICFLIACVGWLAQFLPGLRRSIVCQSDLTRRHGEPSAKQNLSCVMVFVMIYYFVLAGGTWFVILAYAWDFSFRSVGLPRESVDSKVAYFHLIAWSVPLVLTITIMALGEVDGDSISGICFVGYLNHAMRFGFLLGPFLIILITGCTFLTRSLMTLLKVRAGSEEVVNKKAHEKIHRMIVRITLFASFAIIFVGITFGCHIYEYVHQDEWKKSIQEFIICQANISVAASSEKRFEGCQMKSTPSTGVICLHMSAFFGAGIVASSWVWTRSTLHTWRRFLLHLLQHPSDEPVKVRRHEIIAKAFAQRQKLNQGRLSLSFQSAHEDPVAMNLELNSMASQDISSTWAMALPKFMMRRGALVGTGPLGIRRYSSTSELSQRRFSLDSHGHRQSLDSQVSIQFSEQEWVAAAAHAHALARHQRRKTRKERERLLRAHNRVTPFLPHRRGSDTSQQSTILAAAKATKATVTKSTSTGDLTQMALLHQRPMTAFLFSQPLRAKQESPSNPPFTHGMSDNSHLRNMFKSDCALSTNSASPRSPTDRNSTGAASNLPTQSNMPVSTLGMPHFAAPGYQFGYLGGLNYNMIPGYLSLTSLPGAIGYGGYLPFPYNIGCAPGYVGLSSLLQQEDAIIPLHPHIDSASETEFIPIVISESEYYTDAGFRTNDEMQVLSAQRLLEEYHQQLAQQQSASNDARVSASESAPPRPGQSVTTSRKCNAKPAGAGNKEQRTTEMLEMIDKTKVSAPRNSRSRNSTTKSKRAPSISAQHPNAVFCETECSV